MESITIRCQVTADGEKSVFPDEGKVTLEVPLTRETEVVFGAVATSATAIKAEVTAAIWQRAAVNLDANPKRQSGKIQLNLKFEGEGEVDTALQPGIIYENLDDLAGKVFTLQREIVDAIQFRILKLLICHYLDEEK